MRHPRRKKTRKSKENGRRKPFHTCRCRLTFDTRRRHGLSPVLAHTPREAPVSRCPLRCVTATRQTWDGHDTTVAQFRASASETKPPEDTPSGRGTAPAARAPAGSAPPFSQRRCSHKTRFAHPSQEGGWEGRKAPPCASEVLRRCQRRSLKLAFSSPSLAALSAVWPACSRGGFRACRSVGVWCVRISGRHASPFSRGSP